MSDWGAFEDVAGAALIAVAALDLLLTVFNYDGFNFLAGRYQRACWRGVLLLTSLLPSRPRRGARSLGSAMLVPATVALWLSIEISGFALLYHGGLVSHGLHLTQPLAVGWGSAFYFSAGVIWPPSPWPWATSSPPSASCPTSTRCTTPCAAMPATPTDPLRSWPVITAEGPRRN
ncbi:MAG TPA: hypothetical protein VFH70_03210 [Acidimicrobiales bacterium]|nr:hypothetical protein [Acidimicrobiales bacterium]